MIFREITFAEADYRASLKLRDEVLRRPLEMSLSEADCLGESGQRHFGLFQDTGELVACVIAVKLSPTKTKLRQMAVAEKFRGQGLGRKLLGHVEKTLAGEGTTNLVLHARQSAVEFYEKLDYLVQGEEFTEIGLPHFLMHKRLGFLSTDFTD